MNKVSRIIATSYDLTVTASEEASRFGVRDIDIEHVLLALVLDEGPAGRTLRSTGITLDAARSAVADQHREQLATLGIDAPLPGDGRIRAAFQNGHEWTDRATKLLSDSGSHGRKGDTEAVLRAALAERSGTIDDLLQRLGTTPSAVASRLDEAPDTPSSRPPADGRLSRTRTAFVPAPVDDVWAYVSDPERLPEWDMNLAHIRPDHEAWIGETRTTAPDGKQLKVRANAVQQRISRTAATEPRHVTWEMRYPDAPRANRRRIAIDIDPAPGGSRITVRFAWVRGPGPTGLMRLIAPVTRLLARPVVAIALWVQVTVLTGAISRALRDA